jgi:hypothetical protein
MQYAHIFNTVCLPDSVWQVAWQIPCLELVERAGLCWRTVLMAMTARYFGSLASPMPPCSKLDRLVALMAVRHGRRVCSSSHSADTWPMSGIRLS